MQTSLGMFTAGQHAAGTCLLGFFRGGEWFRKQLSVLSGQEGFYHSVLNCGLNLPGIIWQASPDPSPHFWSLKAACELALLLENSMVGRSFPCVGQIFSA